MKKTLLKIFVAVLSFVLLVGTLVGCGGSSFSTSMKDWGKTDGYENGGFVRETENYVYLINGQGKNTDSNNFGAPLKGALIAVKKDGFGTKDQEVQIVVPKLFVGTDYKAGIYIFGDYVYYATPSTDKTPDGEIANTELVFTRTKLDGTDSKTYFKLEGLSTEFRVVKNGNDVIFVFYDSVQKELALFNTTTGKRESIIKTDDTAEVETLASYFFVDNSATDDVVVIYTTKVFAEAYDKAKADALGSQYSRSAEKFNNVYAYKLGEESPKLILDGKYSAPETERQLKLTYTVQLIKNGLVFYKQVDVDNIGKEKYFVSTIADFYNGQRATAVTNSADAVDGTLIVFLDTADKPDTADKRDKAYKLKDKNIVETTLIGDVVFAERTVAKTTDGSKLMFVDGVYAYYTNASDVLYRVNIDLDNRANYKEEELEEQRVSEDKIHSSWYKPVVMEIGKGKYALYLDISTSGASYVKAINLNAEIQQTKEDGEVTETFIDGDFHVAVLTDLDISIIATEEINKMDKELTDSGNVILDVKDENGKPIAMKAILDARKVYENLTKAQKNLMDGEVLAKIEKYEKAVEISVILDGLKDFDKAKSDEEKKAFRPAYETAKPIIEKLEKDESGLEISSILAENYRWYYQQADNFFTSLAEDK